MPHYGGTTISAIATTIDLMKLLRVNIGLFLGKDFPVIAHNAVTIRLEFLELAEVLQITEDATHFSGLFCPVWVVVS